MTIKGQYEDYLFLIINGINYIYKKGTNSFQSIDYKGDSYNFLCVDEPIPDSEDVCFEPDEAVGLANCIV